MSSLLSLYRKKSKKKKNSKRSEDREDLLPPVIVRQKGNAGFHLNGADDESTSEANRWNAGRDEVPFSSGMNGRTSSLSRHHESADDQQLINEMFGDSSEMEIRKPGKKRKKRKPRDD